MRAFRIAIICAIILGLGVFAHPSTTIGQRTTFRCEGFRSQQEAQEAFRAANYTNTELDPDGNGIACDDQVYDFHGPVSSENQPATDAVPAPTDVVPVPTDAAAPADNAVPAASSHTAIYAGDCAPGEFVDPVAPLNEPALPTGETIGTKTAGPVATSFTTIPVSLATLTQAPHVLVVFDPAHPDQLLACGEIGGVAETDGALAIVLVPSEEAGPQGIAYLSPTGNGLGVSIFLTTPEGATQATPAS